MTGPGTPRDPWTVVVDGHEFRVHPRPDEPGVYDFDWRTGPPDYGFTSAGSTSGPVEVEAAIRDFLAQVDPETGYLED